MNPYEILGVDKNTNVEDIKIKYRQLASENHPDKGGDAEKFKLISLAYQILIDPVKRKSYDNNGIFFADTSVYNEAIDHLRRIFNNQINAHDPDLGDLIFSMRGEAELSKHHVVTSLDQTKKMLTKLEKVKKKLKMKQKSENLLLTMLDVRIHDCHVDINGLTRRLQVYDYVLIVLGNYHYGDNEWMELLANEVVTPIDQSTDQAPV
jgi:DnaJ-class molecular chaperone